MKSLRSKGPELLLDMAAHVEAILIGDQFKLPADVAKKAADTITERMALHWGGQNVYFPMGHILKTNQLAREIWREFNGENQAELAKKYKKSIQWIYSLIAQMREADRAERQPQLWPDDEAIQ